MSILTRPKRLNKSIVTSSSSISAVTAPPMRNETEAPDRGTSHREAPENRQGRHSEAPDSGEGRAFHLESEFTHGRSQS